MVDVADKLAASFIESRGWCCILIQASDDARSCVASVEGVAARDEPGQRVWLASKHADKLMASFLSRCQQSRRRPRGNGLIVQLPVSEVARQIRSIAESYGYAVAADELIDEQLALVSRRITDALPRVTKGFGKEYAAARAGGTPLPRYQDWLIARLQPALQAGLG